MFRRANNMDWSSIRCHSTKKGASATLVFRIIFKELAASQTVQDVIESKVFSRHFLMGVKCEPNLTSTNLLNHARFGCSRI
jgi:hypothetical protein